MTSLRSPPPSLPGEPPRTTTGALPESIIKESADNREVWRVGHKREFPIGAMLELGTERVAARPHLRPAFDTVVNKVERLVAEG